MPKQSSSDTRAATSAFTLVELLTVMVIISVLSSLLLPALSKARARAQAVLCLNNTRQLTLGWLMYAAEHDDRLPYNLGGKAAATNLNNWAAGVQDWDLTPDNTNTLLLTEAALGSYVGKATAAYRCPADAVLSQAQIRAGWASRIRSYSMNASVGDAGNFSAPGYNINNPSYVQFFKLASIPQPANIFVFLDEHPDSIGDGYFVNKASNARYGNSYGEYPSIEWLRLPASYHNGAAGISFGDGHAEIHRWQSASTKPPSRPNAANLPVVVPSSQAADFNWIAARMSVGRY